MAPTTEQIVELCALIVSEENMQATVRESIRGGLIAGLFATAGSLIAGPRGLAIGGAFGGALAAYLAQDNFLPVSTVNTNGYYEPFLN